ncbi:MAG: toxic anion resistance protein [Clostridiales bacterium]|nr:toxic anion resistance protein [Clostridiales bacterium]
MEVPALTLTPENEAAAAEKAQEDAVTASLDISQLTEAEQKAVNEFAKQIDITDTNAVLQYGAAAQKNIADFSGTTLNNIRTKDMGQVGDMLSNLVVELKGFNFSPEEKKGLKGLFRKATNHIAVLKAQYDKAEVNVDKITEMLESHQITLLKDVAVLDKMYKLNQTYFKELAMYILAGKQRLAEVRENELVALQKKAEESGLPEDAQAANDFANMCNRFEKKIHDLELTRMVSIQMAPQIRLIQNNNSLMIEKIQTSIVNTIPLWKSQMVLALSMYHSQQAMEAQRSVTNVTNELLRKNAEALKMGSIDAARESERGIVDLETLKHTNQMLIETLESVRQIQAEGTQKRREAEAELGRIEGELRQKLLDIRK